MAADSSEVEKVKARWRAPVPPVDLRRWWHGYLGHFLEGALAAAAMTAGPMLWPDLGPYLFGAGALLLAGSIAAQWLGFLRKNDTPGRDVHHVLLGYCAGLLCCGAWLWRWG